MSDYYKIPSAKEMREEIVTVKVSAHPTCHKKWIHGYGFCSECGCNISSLPFGDYCWKCRRRIVPDDAPIVGRSE
jgi:predicted amidophosphoribosyltransferase